MVTNLQCGLNSTKMNSQPFFGIKLNPVLEIPTPVVGGSVGVYAYTSNIATSAGIELNFLLGKLKDKRK